MCWPMVSWWPLSRASIRSRWAFSAWKLSKDGTGTRKLRRAAHHALHLSLVVTLARTAEAVLEQVVGLKLGEGPGALSPAVPQYLSHRQLGVVVQDAPEHSTQEGERRDVAVQEGLGGFCRIGLDEAAVAMGQVQDEIVGLPLHSADDHPGLAEVALGVSRRMG